MDAAHREGAAGGQRPLHVPGTVLHNVLYCTVLHAAQHGPDEVQDGGPQRDHQARHHGRDGAQGGAGGRQRQVRT